MIRGEDILLLIIAAGWLSKMAVNKELGFMRATSLNAPIYFYLLVCIVSTLISVIQGFNRLSTSAFHLLKYFEYFLLFFMVTNNLKTMKQARKYVVLLLLTCLIVSLWALKDLGSVSRLTAPFEGKEGEPNTFAAYLLLMMALMLGLMLYLNSIRQRLAIAGAFGAALLTFVYTLSRGGWLGFFPMLLTIALLGKRWKFSLIIALVVLVIALPSLLPQRAQERIRETFTAESSYTFFGHTITLSESANARINTWKDAFVRLRYRPFLGFGVPTATLIDSQYTRVLSEVGLVGFTVYCWLLLRIFVAGRRVFRQTTGDNFCGGVSLGFLAGFIGLLIHAFSAATFIIIRVMEPFWFLAGIVVMLPELRAAEIEELSQGEAA